MTDALTIPGLYWQVRRAAEATVDHAGRAVFVGALPGFGVDDSAVVRGWGRFCGVFGAGEDPMRLALRGFFANGGAVCRVVPLPADGTLDPALAELEDDDDISLVVTPGLVDLDRQAAVAAHCARLGDRFAVLDLPEPETLSAAEATETARSHARALQTRLGVAADNVALYGPWLEVVSADGTTGHAPPSGHVAGVYARVDAERGVFHAPANVPLEDVVDLRFDFADAQLAALYPPFALDGQGRVAEPSVNIIRALPGRGLRVWGARTLSANASWRHVPVRRLTLDLERWMTRRLDAMVFETNDIALRNRVVRELGAHLDGLYHRGALVGPVSALSWFVQCDESNNPLDVQQAGLLIADVGIAPAVPGEYITLRLIARSASHGATSEA